MRTLILLGIYIENKLSKNGALGQNYIGPIALRVASGKSEGSRLVSPGKSWFAGKVLRLRFGGTEG
jgi:hypothetical protein